MGERSSNATRNDSLQMGSYYGTGPSTSPPPPPAGSTTYAPDKGRGSSSSSKGLSLNDPEFQRKKRVAGYKAYTVERKVKGSLRKSFRWLNKTISGWW